MFLKRVASNLYHKQSPMDDPSLRLRYLGTAGFVIEGNDRVLVIDPFVTRPGLWTTMFRPLIPNAELIQKVLPRADDVLVGHSHFDHILDAPVLCQQTGARLIGSPSTCRVGRAAGLPEEQLVETLGHETIQSGNAMIRGLPSLHGRVYFNHSPLPGEIKENITWPARYRELLCGLVLNWYIEVAGHRIVHIDSADFYEKELEGVKADILCLCAIGRNYRPNYLKHAIEMLEPKMIIPCHWDWFFTPYGQEPKCLPGVDLPGMVKEIEAFNVTPVVLPFDGLLELGAGVEVQA